MSEVDLSTNDQIENITIEVDDCCLSVDNECPSALWIDLEFYVSDRKRIFELFIGCFHRNSSLLDDAANVGKNETENTVGNVVFLHCSILLLFLIFY